MPPPAAQIIIVGAGPVGLHAARLIGEKGHRPIIIDTLPFVGGRCAALYPDSVLYDVPNQRDVTAAALVNTLKTQLLPHDPICLTSRRVKSVWGSLQSGFNIETDTGETITGAAVIYAAGSGALRPCALAVNGADTVTDGVSYLPSNPKTASGKRVAVLGDGDAAVHLALETAARAQSVALIHSAPLRAQPGRLDDLTRATTAKRLSVIEGDLARLHGADGRLAQIDVSINGANETYNVDLLLVQAGLEYAPNTITGLTDIANALTGETATPGVFIIGDAVPSTSRPPLISAGFLEAARAAEAIDRHIAPKLASRSNNASQAAAQPHQHVA